MKKIVFGLMLVLGVFAFGQKQVNYTGFDLATNNSELTTLQGNWKINTLITDKETKEYFLYPQNLNEIRISYGNNISINPNGTFISSYSAPCGNDCFTASTGKYKIIDENYVCFYLEKITQHGECFGVSEPNEDLGLYYYYKTENGLFILLKSNGSLEQDKKNVLYRDLIIAKDKEMSEFGYINYQNNLFKWKETKLTEEKEIIAFCMAENQIKNYEILYSLRVNSQRGEMTVLVKTDEELKYVVYGRQNYTTLVGLYDVSQIKKADNLVSEIDNNKKLNRKFFKETYNPKTTSSDKNTIKVYQNKSGIQKIIYQEYYSGGGSAITTFYLQNEEPIYIIGEVNTVYNQQKIYTSITGFYISNWKNRKAIEKQIKREAGEVNYYRIEEKYNRIIKQIKSNK